MTMLQDLLKTGGSPQMNGGTSFAMQILDFFKERSSTLRAETRQVLRELPGRQLAGTREEQLATLDEAVANLHTQAGKVTHLLDFVSLNMAALRKILKKFKKHIEPLAPMQGFLALEVISSGFKPFHSALANSQCLGVMTTQRHTVVSGENCYVCFMSEFKHIMQVLFLPCLALGIYPLVQAYSYAREQKAGDKEGFLRMQIDHPNEPDFHLSQVRLPTDY